MERSSEGPCAKQVVKATLITLAGNRIVGYNSCSNPQAECPRGSLPSGVGYEMCQTVCQQIGHAEDRSLRIAGAEAVGATVYVEGHTMICSNCQRLIDEAGAIGVVGAPPEVA